MVVSSSTTGSGASSEPPQPSRKLPSRKVVNTKDTELLFILFLLVRGPAIFQRGLGSVKEVDSI
jgi:hypothetical protein